MYSGSQLPKLPNGSIFEGKQYMEYANTVYIYIGRQRKAMAYAMNFVLWFHFQEK